MSDLDDFLKLVAEGKQDYKQNDPVGKKLEEVKEHVKTDILSLFAQLSDIADNVRPMEEVFPDNLLEIYQDEHISEVIQETPDESTQTETMVEEVPFPAPKTETDSVKKYIQNFNNASFQQPDVPKVDPTIKAVQDKLKFLEQWVGKISAAGPGSGEVNLRYLDDVYRPSIYDGRYLRYNDTLKKFEFAEVNPHDITYTTTLVETPTYTVTDQDYYVGVNYAGPVTITLPLIPSSGRMIIIKDESGNAETNPITVQGTVDNDAGGFIIQINNGAIQMIYRNGWRIV
jgi:hypothetical protein